MQPSYSHWQCSLRGAWHTAGAHRTVMNDSETPPICQLNNKLIPNEKILHSYNSYWTKDLNTHNGMASLQN